MPCTEEINTCEQEFLISKPKPILKCYRLVDESEDYFEEEDNEIGFNDVDGDGLNTFEYDHLPNDLNHNILDENGD
ncbi:hypothetical protein Q3G72_006185 [Acer saccharum]|nr:hypothetical protein Q3G72_006185 [Acer saccharum]